MRHLSVVLSSLALLFGEKIRFNGELKTCQISLLKLKESVSADWRSKFSCVF